LKLLNHTLSYLAVASFVVIGVWAFIFYINMLDEIYDSIDDGLANSKILIINKVHEDSTLIHKTDFLESNYAIREVTDSHAHDFKDVYMDSTLYMQYENDFEPVRILKTAFRADNGKYYELNIVSSMVEEDDLIEDLLFALIWLYVFLLGSVLLINNFLLKKIWKPFYSILDTLKNFRLGGKEKIDIIKTNVDEFTNLNETIQSLLERTVNTFNQQKQFTENAAHELQTPLAISINKLELLTDKAALPEDQLQEISTVIQSLERLTRLNKTLLLLSKIENRQFPDETEVNFNTLAERVAAAFSDIAEFKGVHISTLQEGNLVKKMNAELAEILFSNLVKNAILHNQPGGYVTVRISPTTLSVENSGEPASLDKTHIFQRFYKNAAAKSSTGLGLAIVKSITDYYGFKLEYTFTSKHLFSVQFFGEETSQKDQNIF
jgi:signal transduction histidine kinase